jgi:N-acetyl-1-D-myo-inositol-2-amino-2-deoxy-alpha-D-glucopyranoside deacetylase
MSASPLDHDRRLLLVHAHPDDESIETGATMAKYASEGAYVCLVTCTLGEEGEVIPGELAHLAPDREDRLGEHRIGELAAACEALGVTDRRFLGGAGRWRDSGMMGVPSNDHPRCLWRADLEEAARELAMIIREVRPQVIVTYDARGYYGHPDHIQAHRIARLAADRAADGAADKAADSAAGSPADSASDRAAGRPVAAASGEPWRVAKFYATAMPLSALEDGLARLRAADTTFEAVGSMAELPFGIPDDQVTTSVDATDHLPAKVAAMRAHRTQISVDPPFYALSDGIGQLILGVEHYTLLSGEPSPPDPKGAGTGPGAREVDLFAGL